MGTQPAPREKLCIQVTASGDLGRIRRGISLRLHRAQTRPETRQHGVEISVYPGSTSTPNRSGGSIAFAAIRPFRPALVRIFRAVVAFFVFSVAAGRKCQAIKAAGYRVAYYINLYVLE
ncbi:hypothetical protein L596_025227 [Steinernema carpocapsae]|uniref:Uncharacterized protein n=1 Tax=Steinernema carpocapsae TaxID=34508 RepID=A0A4U5M765_STECR|nr:hypothetical protein L596_025227 [Steinernema carpocapsae]